MPKFSFFKFSSGERAGILILAVLIIACQTAFFFIKQKSVKTASVEEKKWLSLQASIDSVNLAEQNISEKIYPFNPNFLTDYRAYKLGISTAEIDRLFAYRKQNKFVNSAAEFQAVTKVSDSLLAKISPYFKFPDWAKNKKQNFQDHSIPKNNFAKEKIQIIDINLATKEDLIKVYGIGDGLSDRILKQKELLGGFVNMEQMQDIWGLSPDVIAQLNQRFRVEKMPVVKKIKINDASMKELGQFPYFKYPISKEIITYRSMNNKISGIEDLTKIKGFPVEKVKIIALYLEF
ncbi:helix-hairpin-helix domain-containing protein [Flavobacterium sp. NST-5]|uniref:Helix-hairpin-helix domain-containing protein n=1 Tax=Flavobacterium ichthyis TaxID=2698827 RepID=A0ABW9ZBE0_9FLAO|nr:helix-hairpin-helix domain-containing protein [Flavobacterium ichthyis]NBL64410.1 helix-hairpin-helix domain-containing protein [Flavobacterium ichthyis]